MIVLRSRYRTYRSYIVVLMLSVNPTVNKNIKGPILTWY